jgi:hypothetical protein
MEPGRATYRSPAIYGGNNLPEPADPPVADKLADVPVLLIRSALGSGLEDDTVSPDRSDHCPAFGDCQTHGLLAIDVYAFCRSLYHRNSVPVVGRCYADGVNVLSRQQVAKIDVGATAFVLAGLVLLCVMVLDYFSGGLSAKPLALPSFLVPVAVFVARLSDIANGNNLDIRVAQKRPHIIRAHAADTDRAHSYTLARRDAARPAESSRRNHIRKG